MDMTKVPYTIEDITKYLKVLFPDDGLDVDNWVNSRFENFKQLGRKLPQTIKITTLRKNWTIQYKNRGRSGIRFDRGRVFKNEKELQ